MGLNQMTSKALPGQRLAMGVAVALASGMVASCGGGGGGNVRVDPPPAALPPTPPVVYAPDYRYSQHIAGTGTQAARDAGLTGKGVVVGIVDSGVNRNHPALQGRVTSNLVYVGSGNNLSKDDVVGHGTAVAQALGGTAFGAWPGGIAPGVTIVSARIISDTPPKDDGSGQGNEVNGALGLKPIHQDLINRGVKVMNNSWGGLYWTNPAATAPIADEYRPFIASNGGLVVFAAGNEARANPSDMAALPSQLGSGGSAPAADLERGWLTVVALDENNPAALASYSNACGAAMNYCLAAPGTVIVTGTEDKASTPEYWKWSGTSLAAPLVSGAAAVVWEAFPYFNNDLVRQTLLGTASDLGATGVDPVFGWGKLNVATAIRGPARFDWGDVTVSFNGINSTWSNPISGNGGLVKQGNGTLVLQETASYLGATRVQGGTLVTRGGLTGDVFVSTGATLELAGLTLLGDVSNAGNLVISGSGRGRAVGGDYLQQAGSVLSWQVGSPLSVMGHAQLAGELRVNGVASGYTYRGRETVLMAQGGVSGRFDSLGSTANVFLQATPGYDANSAWLDITRLDVTAAAKAMAAATPASLASAQRVESAFQQLDRHQDSADASFITMAGQLQAASTEAVALASLDSLSGELHARADAMTFDTIDLNRRALGSRTDMLLDGGRAGAWFQSSAGAGRGNLAADGFAMQGWTLGQEQSLAGNGVLGVAFGESHASSRTGGSERGQDRQAYGLLYAGAHWGQGYVLGQLGMGDYRRQLQRDLQLGAQASRVGSDYGGQTWNANVEAGYRWGRAGAMLTPYVALDRVRVERDGFVEADVSGFGLQTVASVVERNRAIAGLRASSQRGRWQLRGFAEWQQWLDGEPQWLQASFTGLETWSPVVASSGFGSRGVAGLAVDAWLGKTSQLSLGYDSTFGPLPSEQQVSARLSVGF